MGHCTIDFLFIRWSIARKRSWRHTVSFMNIFNVALLVQKGETMPVHHILCDNSWGDTDCWARWSGKNRPTNAGPDSGALVYGRKIDAINRVLLSARWALHSLRRVNYDYDVETHTAASHSDWAADELKVWPCSQAARSRWAHCAHVHSRLNATRVK